ncbi:MAG: hypothetical protein IPG25_18425 [Proteobacteria bacterium]|nr:hypothetical protein [Pseudomonadota bacterium]
MFDEGTLEIRGGGPLHDRDEHFQITQQAAGGYLLETQIVPLDQRYRCETRFEYDAAWLPQAVSAKVDSSEDSFSVEIRPAADHADIIVQRAAAAPDSRRVPFSPETLIDCEPTALTMWTMSKCYDRETGGVQTFPWIGRSLLRDLVLEDLQIPLECHGVDARGERFTFTETYPLPNGGSFTLKFELLLDEVGLLRSFSIDTGASRINGTRR